MNEPRQETTPWYREISRYQWLVLIVASLGWVFDVFEGQIFVASMNEAMPALTPVEAKQDIPLYTNITFAAFLFGGALGGVVFGVLSDRLGRKRTLTYTILLYSLFTCLSAFASRWWEMAGYRFLVALGVGGEWAVASALVAEVFPQRARAWSQSIFHASSVLGTFLAVAAGAFIVANPMLTRTLSLFGHEFSLTGWRVGFLLGIVPALLIIWIRVSLREPERWVKASSAAGEAKASVRQLFEGGLLRRTLIGVGLAAIGLATFWGTHIYGKDVLQQAYQQSTGEQDPVALKRAEMLGMFLVTTGGGLGLIAFGPICERLGRRGAFLFYHAGGLAASLVVFKQVSGMTAAAVLLPIFGFLTLGMHAGYAVYFPELFPTRLRSTGGGFCFNVGRILAAPILALSGWMQTKLVDDGMTKAEALSNAAALLSLLFVLGVVLLLFAPETKGQDLPA
ncbi:MAG TPA: MFS transporter [Gemmataceae bacterium]|jgi:MFS family permease